MIMNPRGWVTGGIGGAKVADTVTVKSRSRSRLQTPSLLAAITRFFWAAFPVTFLYLNAFESDRCLLSGHPL